jgi:hypothetical protein
LAKQRGRDAVEQWLEANSDTSSTLPEGIRIAAVNRIVTQKLNDLGPAEAAAWVGKRTRPEELIAGVTEVAPAYARKEPERAMTWLEKFSATPGFHHRSGEVAMLEYATRDLAGAGEWLNAHLDSPIVSAYIWGYAVQVALEDPEAAAAWAAKLPTTGGWGNTAPGANPWTSMEDVMEGGRTPKTLAMNIQAAARAGQLYRNPETPLPPWEGDPPPHFLRYENPILVKSSPDTEPVLQMKIHPEGGCHAISHGTWTLPFPTYIQQADGSLTLEPTGTQVSR